MNSEFIERKLFDMLMARDFFPAAQRSLQKSLDWPTTEPPPEALYKGNLRARFREDAVMLIEKPPYPKLRAAILPNILYWAERWQQMTDPYVIENRPFWEYFSARLPTSRPSHLAKHLMVLRADDPFWNIWYPPNSSKCRCSVHSVSESELIRDGLTLGSMDCLPLDKPDEGFDFNPGILVQSL